MSFGFSVGPIALADMKWGILGAAVIQIHFPSLLQAISDCCLLLPWSENLIKHVLRVELRPKQDFFFSSFLLTSSFSGYLFSLQLLTQVES